MSYSNIKLALTTALISMTMTGCDEPVEENDLGHDCPFSDDVTLDDGTVHRTDDDGACHAGSGKLEITYEQVCDDQRLNPFNEAPENHGENPEMSASDILTEFWRPIRLLENIAWADIGVYRRKTTIDEFLLAMHEMTFGEQGLVLTPGHQITGGTPWGGNLPFTSGAQMYQEFGASGRTAADGSPLPPEVDPWILDNLISDPEQIRRGDIVVALEASVPGSFNLIDFINGLPGVGKLTDRIFYTLSSFGGGTASERTVSVYAIIAPALQSANDEIRPDFPKNSLGAYQTFWAYRWEVVPDDDGDWDAGKGWIHGWDNSSVFSYVSPISAVEIKINYPHYTEGENHGPTPLVAHDGSGLYFPLRAKYNTYIKDSGICDDDTIGYDVCSDEWINSLPSNSQTEFESACPSRCYNTQEYSSCAQRLKCLDIDYDSNNAADVGAEYCPEMKHLDNDYETEDRYPTKGISDFDAGSLVSFVEGEDYEPYRTFNILQRITSGIAVADLFTTRSDWCGEYFYGSQFNQCFFDWNGSAYGRYQLDDTRTIVHAQ